MASGRKRKVPGQGLESSVINFLEETFHPIWEEIYRASSAWSAYKVLFLDPASADLLTKAAGSLFQTVGISMQRDVMMTICRLADPAIQGNYENLSLRQIRARMPRDLDATILGELDSLLKEIEALSAPVRLWRDKSIAHISPVAALAYLELPEVPAETIDTIIAKMGEFFVKVQLLPDGKVYQDPISTRSARSAKRLLHVLALGVAAAPPWGEYGSD